MAGGSGSRLKASGIDVSKPLLQVSGRPLISWTLDEMRGAGIETVLVAIRKDDIALREFLEQYGIETNVEIVVLDQVMEGTLGAVDLLIDSATTDMCLSTCDLVCREGTFKQFLRRVSTLESDEPLAALAVTSLVHDVAPIWIEVEPHDPHLVRNVGKYLPPQPWCFGNFRWISSKGVATLKDIIGSQSPSRDSQLLGMLATSFPGSVVAIDVGPVIDIDDADDLNFVNSSFRDLIEATKSPRRKGSKVLGVP